MQRLFFSLCNFGLTKLADIMHFDCAKKSNNENCSNKKTLIRNSVRVFLLTCNLSQLTTIFFV